MSSIEKIKLGQFFTKKNSWLKAQIKEFILNSKMLVAFDPFAGEGDLLNVSKELGFNSLIGLDIDTKLNWKVNDSLLNIPHVKDAIIITNPPYIAKQSASRKKIDLSKYFKNSIYDDVYLIALEKMVIAQKYIVAIVPESFINSNFKHKNLLHSITILEENPFEDTENPVCVLCFDGISKGYENIKIYKDDIYLGNYLYFDNLRIVPKNNIKISFNDKTGWLALRAIDSSNGVDKIGFCFKEDMKYDWENGIKDSSRHITLINAKIEENKKELFIKNANEILFNLRNLTKDVILTPFKGNTKLGQRRRRLDFKMARAIIEKSYDKTINGETYEQHRIF